MSTLNLQAENTASVSNQSKSSSSMTLPLRHGKYPSLSEIGSKTFTDTLFDGNPKEVKDFTFEELQDQEWTFQNKN